VGASFGYQDPEHKIPQTAHTSIALVRFKIIQRHRDFMQMVEAGKINLDAP